MQTIAEIYFWNKIQTKFDNYEYLSFLSYTYYIFYVLYI